MGRLIGNRYEIQAELGAGGMGTVFLGLDKTSSQTVAIKQLKREIAQPEIIERFIREGEALRQLNHPNIVKLLDTLEAEGQHYLVMEYVPGGDLRQMLQTGKLPYQRCLNIAIDLADALTRAHRLNIIHRDLKPANVLIAQDNTIRLTDFGVAHVVEKERVTQTDAIVGTLDYLPPEVLNGEPVEPRSDIWAFGVMLFEMLAGQRPFVGNGYLQTLQAIATAPIPDLEALAPDTPIALVDLVYRMLSRDMQARISSVRHIGAELEDILHGRGNPVATKRFETPIPNFRSRPKHNLPAQTTPFVGRENELSELARLVQNPNNRLVSIIAQGGMGKTRLSLEAAERLMPHFEHGVYFVELAPLAESSSIVPAIAQALGYQFQNDGREPKQQINDYLQAKELLLVLDNFEHLLDGANLVSDLLKAAPKLKILVTSRQRLDQPSETLFHLSGMDFPAWETPEDALEYAAVKLFMNSASRAKPDFELTADNLDAVARICKLVQGMPLAIVLAASWLGMLSPEEVASELKKGLDFLETDSQQIPERQRSMRAVMDYSWKQMSGLEQAVFAKLSVFRGGFTREAAEAVAGANLRILMSLVNKSLIHRDSTTGRYEIHELLRQYAEEKGDIKASRDSHSKYFASWTKAREDDLKGSRDLEAVKAIRYEFENVKAAWYWALEHEQVELLEQMPESLLFYHYFIGQVAEVKVLILPILKLTKYPVLYSKAHAIKSLFSKSIKLEELEESLRLAEDNLNLGWQALLIIWICRQLPTMQRDDEAHIRIDLSLERLQQSDEKWLLAFTLLAKALLHLGDGTLESFTVTTRLLKAAYDNFSRLSNTWGKSNTAYLIGMSNVMQGHNKIALEAYQEMIQIAKEYNSQTDIANAFYNMGELYMKLGDYEMALDAQQNSMQIWQRESNTELYFNSAIGYAQSLLYLERYEEAQALLAKLKYLVLEFEEDSDTQNNMRDVLAYVKVIFAFQQKDYRKTIELAQAYLELDSQLSWSLRDINIYMGCSELVLGDLEAAEKYFREALPRSLKLLTSFHAIYGFAAIAQRRNQKKFATEHAVFVLEHHATSYEFKQYAKELLAKLENEMPAEEYQAAYERGKLLDAETVVQQILSESF